MPSIFETLENEITLVKQSANLARGLRSNSPSQWLQQNRVNVAGMREVIWEPLYDTITYPAAGAASLKLFQVAAGQGGKTLSDTNMDLGGQLPNGKAFKVTSIQLAFYSGAKSVGVHDMNTTAIPTGLNLTNDVKTFAENGSLIFNVGSKDQLRQAPLGAFPPAERLDGFSASAIGNQEGDTDNLMYFVEYATPQGRLFSINDVLLESNQNFSIELRDLPALPTGLDGKIVCTLNGFMGRNVQ